MDPNRSLRLARSITALAFAAGTVIACSSTNTVIEGSSQPPAESQGEGDGGIVEDGPSGQEEDDASTGTGTGPRCGDGKANRTSEACDGDDLRGATCATVVGPTSTGLLRCSTSCRFDAKGCSGCKPECAGKVCGDDGCGGSCGTCKGSTCNAAGRCIAAGGCEPPTTCPTPVPNTQPVAQYCVPSTAYTECTYCPTSCGFPQYFYNCSSNGGPPFAGCTHGLANSGYCCPQAACMRTTIFDGNCANAKLPPKAMTCHPSATLPAGCMPMKAGQNDGYYCCP